MNKNVQKIKRQKRVRALMHGTEEKPRLSIFRSNTSMYAQLIDDGAKKTICAVSEKNIENIKGTKIEKSKALGQYMAKIAQDKKVKKVIFDRGSYRYHGRVAAFAEGAREGGLEF